MIDRTEQNIPDCIILLFTVNRNKLRNQKKGVCMLPFHEKEGKTVKKVLFLTVR
jgi:hypothetical protein